MTRLAELAPPGVLGPSGVADGEKGDGPADGTVPCVRDVTISLTAGEGSGGSGGGGCSGGGEDNGSSAGGGGGSRCVDRPGFVAKVMGLDGRTAACVWDDRRIHVMEGAAAAAAACRRPD